jgi:hypothetical protein
MPVDLSWYIPLRVVRIYVHGEIPLDVIRNLADRLAEYIEPGITPVHFLLDDFEAEPPPIDVRILTNAYGTEVRNRDLVGWVVGVGKTNSIAKIVIPLFMKALRIKFIRFDTYEEAIEFLKTQDRTL